MTRWRLQFHAFLCAATALAACSSAGFQPPPISPLHDQPVAHIGRSAVLAVSPGMKAFTERHAVDAGPGRGKAWSLTYAVQDPYLLDFSYDPQVTLTAAEAFEARRGNCLSFSSLFIAMAREAGLDAWYQEIEIPTTWSNVNDTLLVSKHVNAVVRVGVNRYTIDVSRRNSRKDDVARRLRDEEAEAQYYNNLGADALVETDLPTAFAYFRLALEVEPNLAYVWSNLGVVYRRNDQTPDAIRAYRFALKIEPEQAVALNNLYLIYEEDGDLEGAAEMKRRVERNRRRNPYYIYHLAELAIEEQRYAEAEDLLERAIEMKGSEYRFHYVLAQMQYRAGESDAAQASLSRARELAPANPPDGPLVLPDPTF